MKEIVTEIELINIIKGCLELLKKRYNSDRHNRVISLGVDVYLYGDLRFSFTSNILEVRHIKHDNKNFLLLYSFRKRRDTKIFPYKTVLLKNRMLSEFKRLCIHEFKNRR